jgi:hypothetical protein
MSIIQRIKNLWKLSESKDVTDLQEVVQKEFKLFSKKKSKDMAQIISRKDEVKDIISEYGN